MQLLQLTRKIVATSLLVPAFVFADIGNIFEQTGSRKHITRQNDTLDALEGVDILLYDTLVTGNGRIAVNFLDDSNLRLTEHSEVLIDEVIYDPNPSKLRWL